MNKLAFVAFVISTVVAEPPAPGGYSNSGSSGSGIVDAALLARVGEILANGGDGSNNRDSGGATNEGSQVVDSELLDRIANIINQNELSVGRSSFSSSAVAPSNTLALPTDSYGAPGSDTYAGVQPPPANRNFGGSVIKLGMPQVAHRIASFDIQENRNSQGLQVPSTNSYSLPSVGGDTYSASGPSDSPSSSRHFDFGQPEEAERIASFDIQQSASTTKHTFSYRPPQARGGPY